MLRRVLLDPSLNDKAWYLWCFASYVSVGPFLNVFFEGRGLSKAQVGLIGALRPWTSAPASFLWAALADRLHAHRAVLVLALVGSVGVRMLLLLPRRFGGLLAVALAAEVLSAPVSVLADAAVMRICEKGSDYGKYRLWGAVGWGGFSTPAGWLISHLGIRWAFYSQAILSVPSLIHGARLFSSGRTGAATPAPGHHHKAPPGAAQGPGGGGGGPRGGASRSHGHGDSGDDYDGGPCESDRDGDVEAEPLLPVKADALEQLERLSHRSGSSATVAAAAAPALGGEAGSARRAAAATAGGGGEALRGRATACSGSAEEAGAVGGGGGGGSHGRRLWALLRRWEVLLFFVVATVMGYGFGTIDSFLFLYLEEMGASGTLMGLTLTITCAAEVPAFQLQDRLLDRWGVAAVLDLTQAVYALRLALYAALPLAGNVLWVLPIEVLHGVTFACGWGAGTVNCKLLAPPELAATLQGAFQGLYFGAGYGLGSLVGGWLGSRLGWQRMFACASATMLAFWMVTMAARRVLSASGMPTSSVRGKSVELSPAANA